MLLLQATKTKTGQKRVSSSQIRVSSSHCNILSAAPPALPAVAQSACECRSPRRWECLLCSSRNCFAAASISMQQFHQTRFIRKTFCRRLIERCQTESMLPGHCQTFSAIWILRVWEKRPLPAEHGYVDADEEFLFRICVNRRVLRASPDSVAAGRAVLSVAKWLSTRNNVRKNGASHKHHKIKQLQQIITAVRHRGKNKTVNISLFFGAGGF